VHTEVLTTLRHTDYDDDASVRLHICACACYGTRQESDDSATKAGKAVINALVMVVSAWHVVALAASPPAIAVTVMRKSGWHPHWETRVELVLVFPP